MSLYTKSTSLQGEDAPQLDRYCPPSDPAHLALPMPIAPALLVPITLPLPGLAHLLSLYTTTPTLPAPTTCIPLNPPPLGSVFTYPQLALLLVVILLLMPADSPQVRH